MLNNNTITTPADLENWRENSVETAENAGFELGPEIEHQLLCQTPLYLNTDVIPADMWTGRCYYFLSPDAERRGIEVEFYEKNLSNFGTKEVLSQLTDRGIPFIARLPIALYLRALPTESFRQFAGQTGMDHELIGHGYHYLAKQRHDEVAAIEAQMKMAKQRAAEAWQGDPRYPIESFSVLEKMGFNISWIVASNVARPILHKHKRKDIEMGL